ncbi:MAG TPA: hypothetical protein VNE40_03280 [Candidatus Dormibacteraeota bacterium]|nr:hypothetical protein [Candidatus Dormibacteraeota bacterium]
MDQKLIFVYNAKAGFVHGVMDLMHKTASPKTYPCKLCMVTFSGATMNRLWKSYVSGLGIPSVFMHRDEFAKTYPNQQITFPVVLLEEGDSITTLISSDEFKNITDLAELMSLLNAKLKKVKTNI